MVPPAGAAVRAPELRYLNQPKPVRVLADRSGIPRTVALGRQAKRVQQVRDWWRVDDGWWRDPVARSYYELELAGGEVITVYHDQITGAWYRQGYE